MSKPGGDPSSGISSGDALILPERHPACRRREARPGSGMERENLTGDAKAKGTSGSSREAESTDAPERDAHRKMQYRIGINLGDVIYDDSRIYGDGINVAARLESLAKPGGICISSKVYEDVRGKIDLGYD